MTSTRRTATIVGLLFLTQTVAFIIAEQLIGGVLKGSDYSTGTSRHANALSLGALFAGVSGVAVVDVAVLFFPLLKPTSEPLASRDSMRPTFPDRHGRPADVEHSMKAIIQDSRCSTDGLELRTSTRMR
jgi:hypothetical protein